VTAVDHPTQVLTEFAPARILIADAALTQAEALARVLVARGHEVRIVGSGRDALEELRRDVFDLALLDVGLPTPDGLEIARGIAADGDGPDIVMLTPIGAIDVAVHAMRSGAFAYLASPFRAAEGEAVVRRAL
jgi:two-component system, NtrC family, response regulator PilR